MKDINLAILCTIAAVCAKYNTRYCCITQERFLQLLEEFYDVKITRRTLNYHLKELEEGNLIKRFRRVTRNKDGTLRTLPTVYTLGHKAYFLFKRITAVFNRFIRRTDVQFFALNNSLRSVLDKNNTRRKTKLGKRRINKTPPEKQSIKQNHPPPPKEKPPEQTQQEKKLQTQQTLQERKTSENFKSIRECWKEIQKKIEERRRKLASLPEKRKSFEAKEEERKRRLKEYWMKVYEKELKELQASMKEPQDPFQRIKEKIRQILEMLENKRKRRS